MAELKMKTQNGLWLMLAVAFAILALVVSPAMAEEDAYDNMDYYYSGGMSDPFEPVNRGIYKFNEAVDSVLIRPVAKTYNFMVPEYGRDRVHNVLTNLGEPVDMLNGFMQGDPERGFTAMWRFILNSTFGVLGIFDFAGHNLNLVHRDEDFGQSLGHYGWGSGPYIVLPILGPSSLRDAIGRVVDIFSNPFNYTKSDTFLVSRVVLDGVDVRSRNLDLTDEIYRTSLDPYATIRSMYDQRRRALIRNNEPRNAGIGY